MVGGLEDFLTRKNVSTLLSGTVSLLDSTGESAFDLLSGFIGNLGDRNNTFREAHSLAHRTPRADATPVDRSDLADDVVTSAEVERVGTEMVILN